MGSHMTEKSWLVGQLEALEGEKEHKSAQIEMLTGEVQVITQEINVVQSLLERVGSPPRSCSQAQPRQGYPSDPPAHQYPRGWTPSSQTRQNVHPYTQTESSGSIPFRRRAGTNPGGGHQGATGAASLRAGVPPPFYEVGAESSLAGGVRGGLYPAPGGNNLLSMLNSDHNSTTGNSLTCPVYHSGSNQGAPSHAVGQYPAGNRQSGAGYGQFGHS